MRVNDVKIKYLKKVFKKGFYNTGLLFTQIDRTNSVALYHVTNINKKVDMGYEVFLIKFHKTSNEVTEEYPKDEDFGKTAFSYGTLPLARFRFESLQKEK